MNTHRPTNGISTDRESKPTAEQRELTANIRTACHEPERSVETNRSSLMDRRHRGQSELVGFILIFGIVILAIGLLTATGYAGLTSAQDHERTNTGQLAMVGLADNIDDVASNRAPSRATELTLSDASLSLDEPETITIEGERVSDPTDNFSHTQSTQPIVWDDGRGTDVRYVAGSVIRSDEGNAVIVREPSVLLTDEALVMQLVNTHADEYEAIGGSGTVLVQTRHEGSELVHVEEGTYEVTITVTTSAPDAWDAMLSETPAIDACTIDEETVSCTLQTEQVAITVEHVSVSIG